MEYTNLLKLERAKILAGPNAGPEGIRAVYLQLGGYIKDDVEPNVSPAKEKAVKTEEIAEEVVVAPMPKKRAPNKK